MSFGFVAGTKTEEFKRLFELDSVNNFTSEELIKKYRILALRYHPDVNRDPAAEETMKKINEGFEWLSSLATENSKDINFTSKKPIKEKSLFDLSESCPECQGTGKKKVLLFSEAEKCSCASMYFASSYFGFKFPIFKSNGVIESCSKCSGKGIFTLRSGREVPCKNCGATGIKKVVCKKCNGKGYTLPKDDYQYFTCKRCDGYGEIEIKPFNPVLGKAGVLFSSMRK